MNGASELVVINLSTMLQDQNLIKWRNSFLRQGPPVILLAFQLKNGDISKKKNHKQTGVDSKLLSDKSLFWPPAKTSTSSEIQKLIFESFLKVLTNHINRVANKSSMVLSPLANYTDRAIAAGQRS
jgi:hypothetical protein